MAEEVVSKYLADTTTVTLTSCHMGVALNCARQSTYPGMQWAYSALQMNASPVYENISVLCSTFATAQYISSLHAYFVVLR